MKTQRFFFGIALSLSLIFALQPQACTAMEAAAPEQTVPGQIKYIIFDFFGVLFWVDKQQAELEVPPSTPSSPKFKAEATMRANRWQTMDLGIATKEHVAREAAEKGQDYGAVVSYIHNIASWIKPLTVGMELYKKLRALSFTTLLLSNLSVYCLSGLQDPGYFPRVNEDMDYESPNIFEDARRTATQPKGFPWCEGYSCRMGLGKPDVACYKFFIVLNCPDVPSIEKARCLEIQKQMLKRLQHKFDLEDRIQHAPEDHLAIEEAERLKKQIPDLNKEIALCQAELADHIEMLRAKIPAIDRFAHQCAFIDDSPRNLDGAERAGIYPISCQCHTVAYLTLVKKHIIQPDPSYEGILEALPQSHGDLAHFGEWSLEELHNYRRIDHDLREMHPENFADR